MSIMFKANAQVSWSLVYTDTSTQIPRQIYKSQYSLIVHGTLRVQRNVICLNRVYASKKNKEKLCKLYL